MVMLLFSFVTAAVTSAKVGASDNYYFATFVTALLLAIRHLQNCPPPVRRIGMAAYALLCPSSWRFQS